MTSILKNFYIDKLADIVNKYNNTYHSTIKMKPAGVNSSMYINFDKENNNENTKCEAGNYVRIWKFKNIFANGYVLNWSEEVFVITKFKNTVPWTYVISDVNGEEIVRAFYKKQLQRTNQKEFIVEEVIKRKGDKALC